MTEPTRDGGCSQTGVCLFSSKCPFIDECEAIADEMRSLAYEDGE